MNFYYYYELTYYMDNSVSKAKGITYGNFWIEVMQNLVGYYGENYISEICCLKSIGEGGTCIEVNEMQAANILKEVKEFNYE